MTKMKREAPYGEWKSDISIEAVTADTRSISSVRVCVSPSDRNATELMDFLLTFAAED